jgi:hypothetical protein
MKRDSVETLLDDITKIHETETTFLSDYEILNVWNERITQLSIIYHTFFYEITGDEYIYHLFIIGLKETVRNYKKALRRCEGYEKENY